MTTATPTYPPSGYPPQGHQHPGGAAAHPGRRPLRPRQRPVKDRAHAYYRNSILLDALALMIPLGMIYEVTVVGRLFLAEAICLGAVPFLLMARGRMLLLPSALTIIALGAGWFVWQIVTDLIQGTPYEDYARGWAKIIFFMVNFVVIYMVIYGNRRRTALFLAGAAVALAASVIVRPGYFTEGNPWKFGYGLPVSLAIIWMCQVNFVYRRWVLAVGLCLLMTAAHMYLGWRSMAGIFGLTGFYLMGQGLLGQRGSKVQPLSSARLLLLAGAGIAAIFALLSGYEFLASEGYLGEDAKEHYEQQAAGDLGLLLGGRQEVVVSLEAISDSPIFGHGSWAKDRKYIDLLTERMRMLGYMDINDEVGPSYFGDLIPTHSHITGAWVEAGILGGIFWIWILILIARNLGYLYQIRDPISPMAVFFSILLAWDVLFSPFGAERRIMSAFQIVVLVYSWDLLRQAAAQGKMLRRMKRMQRRRANVLPRRLPPNVQPLPRPSERARLENEAGDPPTDQGHGPAPGPKPA